MSTLYPILNVRYNEGFDDGYLQNDRKTLKQQSEQLAYNNGYDDAIKYTKKQKK